MSTESALFVQLGVHHIDEGALIQQLDESITEAHATLQRRRERGYPTGKVKISAEITLEYDPDMADHVAVRHSVSTRTPKEERLTVAREKGGLLLAPTTGTSEDAPEQMRMFDRHGRLVGTLDKATGEIKPATAADQGVVGKVGQG